MMMNVIIIVVIYRKDQEKGNDCVMYVVEKYTGDLAKVEQPTIQPAIQSVFYFSFAQHNLK